MKTKKEILGVFEPGSRHWVGDGFPVYNLFPSNGIDRRIDPFLMLDYVSPTRFAPSHKPRGVGEHPHRGFETVTIAYQGSVDHRDSAGNAGTIHPGGVQWMTAGSGLVHSELPEQEDGLMSGFQLWLNLASGDKMVTPSYRDLQADEIPQVSPQPGVKVKVIAGNAFGTAGAMQRPTTEPLYLDVQLEGGQQLDLPIPATHNAFLYVFEGALQIGEDARNAPTGRMAILSNSADAAGVSVTAQGNSRFLLIAGRPLNEPIAQWGPFVMNTREQVEQAIQDFRDGKF